MPHAKTILTVFVSSPSDVTDERDGVEGVIRAVNAKISRQLRVRLDLARWETDTRPGLGADPQAVIFEQMPDDYDIFVGIMWSRIGTRTNRALSGTVEEFDLAVQRWNADRSSVSVMFYFKEEPIPISADSTQLKEVQKFRKGIEKQALICPFRTTSDFLHKLEKHLLDEAERWEKRLTSYGLAPSRDSLGLVSVIGACREFSFDGDWAARLTSAKVVEMMGYSLHSTLQNDRFIRQLKDLSRDESVVIRILLADPNSPAVRARSLLLHKDPDLLGKTIYGCRKFLSKAVDARRITPDRRDIRTFSHLTPTYSLVRIDDRMYVMPYLPYSAKASSPLLIIERKDREGLFSTYESDFREIWARSDPLYSPRCRVPLTYAAISSEKGMLAAVVTNYFSDCAFAKTDIRKLLCLDIGCGDGTLSRRVFNQVANRLPTAQTVVTFLDPDQGALDSLCEGFRLNKSTFSWDSVTRRWQEFEARVRFRLILCSHVLGAIYQQCETEDAFSAQFERMIDALAPDGLLAVILAEDTSVELEMRRTLQPRPRKILSADLFEEKLQTGLKQSAQLHHRFTVRSLVRLDPWLRENECDVAGTEAELLQFLFSPHTELTPALVDEFRKGLRSRAKVWGELHETERQQYLQNVEESQEELPEHASFVEMAHACFVLGRA